MDFIECIRDGIERNDELSEGLYSLILFGSHVRGDFIDDVSDLDFFAVLKGESHDSIIPRLKAIIEEYTEQIRYRQVDLAWEHLDNLDDPMNKGYPFKFLTFYQEDFIENHVVVYGKDIVSLLPRYDWEGLLRWRAERLLTNIKRDRDKPEMLRLGAGEVIKLIALMGGAKSIDKADITSTLEVLGDDEALEIFSAYLNGRELEHTKEYWANFMRSRIKKMFEGYG